MSSVINLLLVPDGTLDEHRQVSRVYLGEMGAKLCEKVTIVWVVNGRLLSGQGQDTTMCLLWETNIQGTCLEYQASCRFAAVARLWSTCVVTWLDMHTYTATPSCNPTQSSRIARGCKP